MLILICAYFCTIISIFNCIPLSVNLSFSEPLNWISTKPYLSCVVYWKRSFIIVNFQMLSWPWPATKYTENVLKNKVELVKIFGICSIVFLIAYRQMKLSGPYFLICIAQKMGPGGSENFYFFEIHVEKTLECYIFFVTGFSYFLVFRIGESINSRF